MSFILFLTPLVAGIGAQLLKLAFDRVHGNMTLSEMTSHYGGMPSAHAAFVGSLTTIIGLRTGVDSAAFAIALIFSLITLRDAIGLRRIIGAQSKTLDTILAQNRQKTKEGSGLPHIVGHTPTQALVGALFGISVAVIAPLSTRL